MNSSKFNDIKAFFVRHRLAILILIIGISVLIFADRISEDEKPTDPTDTAPSPSDAKIYTEYLEEKIADLISEIDGISDVSVLLTLEGGNELVYAENKSPGTVDYLIIEGSDGESPVLLREIYSSVRGIAVVCRGGDDDSIKRTVTELLASAFDLPKAKISVAGAD